MLTIIWYDETDNHEHETITADPKTMHTLARLLGYDRVRVYWRGELVDARTGILEDILRLNHDSYNE